MKVIFLDIDGVLNTNDYISALYTKHLYKSNHDKTAFNDTLYRDKYGYLFDPRTVTHLESICYKTGAKIVISSTWRLSGLKTMQNMFRDRKIEAEVIDITHCHVDRIRGKEIQQWLDNNEIESYCILDDDSDMLQSQQNNFVLVDPEFGLTHELSEKCIKILDNEIY
ncbi:MAG: HAD domain-containing protein [Clostridia bacterium]